MRAYLASGVDYTHDGPEDCPEIEYFGIFSSRKNAIAACETWLDEQTNGKRIFWKGEQVLIAVAGTHQAIVKKYIVNEATNESI